MPLTLVGQIVDLEPRAQVSAINDWWATVEQDVRQRRQFVNYLDRYLTGRTNIMYDVQMRDVPEQQQLTAQKRVTVHDLDNFIDDAARTITNHLDAAGARPGPLRVIYHGMVTEDSDGPVEVAVAFEGPVEPVEPLRVACNLLERRPSRSSRVSRGTFPQSSMHTTRSGGGSRGSP